jgi:peptide/nickel transport system ATP-binding protein
MAVISARDLTVSAKLDAAEVPVIRALSFDLAPGKILGLVGESGAGKSMIGRAIAQLLPPGFAITGGSLSFESEDLPRMAPARRRALLGRAIAFIPQAPLTALNPVLTIGQQFDEHLVRAGLRGRTQRRDRVLAMLAAARLANGTALLAQYPHQLSGGMCQRVLIAMAFATDPRLVVADEPTTALDVTLHPQIIRLIADMQKDHGTAVVFITHDLRLAAQVCDDVIVMYAGRAVESGPTRSVLTAPAHPYTRCLKLANPSMTERRALYVIPDQMPGLRQLPLMSGCHFAPRCPLVIDDCRRSEPPGMMVATGHVAACVRAEATRAITTPHCVSLAPSLADRPLLQVDGLSKRYALGGRWFGSNGDVAAAKNASFQIGENEFVALVGESGSGKSTIARLLVGLEQPSSGRILLDGRDLAGLSPAQRAKVVQIVFQDPQSALNPRRRVASIVTQALESEGRSVAADERCARAKELLAEVGLSNDFATRFPAQLSGGQRQRVNIARALCSLPRLLIADEIASGLDVSIQAQLLNLLARLRAELGFAMLFISHDLSVVRHLCSRVLVMYRGEIVEQGPVETVFADPQHPHTRALLTSVPPDEPTAAWSAIAG